MSKVEIWKDIPNYEGSYQVSSLGRVKSLQNNKPRFLKPRNNGNGYYYVCLYKYNKQFQVSVHRLVLSIFSGDSILEVNHINGIKSDNRLENLEYVTPKENMSHAVKNNLHNAKGDNHGRSKINLETAKEIKYNCKGLSQREIARKYSISQQQVSRIRLGLTWKHI